LDLLDRWKGRARLVAGCTNVLPELRAKACQAKALIDLSRLGSLSYIREEKEKIRIGGLTPISELVDSGVIKKYGLVLSDAAKQLGNPLVRNRATLAGNLADASPAADTAVPLLALEASVLAERRGITPREIPIERFFLGPNRTVLKKDEIIREVVFRKPGRAARMAYSKLGLRNSMAISIVSIAVAVELEKRVCLKATIGLGAVAPKPMRALAAEKILIGRELTDETIGDCCEKASEEISPITDVRASAAYRKSMASVLLRRLLEKMA
jgi:carbon-monoxide dehydrogenase medium subunit